MSMTRTLWLMLLAGCLIAASAAGEETDLSGTWMMTIAGKTPPGKNFSILTFDSEGDQLTVLMQGRAGELRGGTARRPARDEPWVRTGL